MSFIKRKTEIIDYPKRLLTYGAPKVGKTTSISQLHNVLIVDTEDGTGSATGDIVNIRQEIANGFNGKPLDVIRELYKELLTDNPYEFISFDSIDMIEYYVAKELEEEYDVESYGDIPYGKGYALLRDRVVKIFDLFADLGLNVIVVGHRKKTIIGSEGAEVKVNDLDLTGKLKNTVSAWASAIGYWNRTVDEKGNTTVSLSFMVSPEENTEAGCRINRLEGKNIPISYRAKDSNEFKTNWKEIYPFLGDS